MIRGTQTDGMSKTGILSGANIWKTTRVIEDTVVKTNYNKTGRVIMTFSGQFSNSNNIKAVQQHRKMSK